MVKYWIIDYLFADKTGRQSGVRADFESKKFQLQTALKLHF